jgi:hypothetical protein
MAAAGYMTTRDLLKLLLLLALLLALLLLLLLLASLASLSWQARRLKVTAIEQLHADRPASAGLSCGYSSVAVANGSQKSVLKGARYLCMSRVCGYNSWHH